MVKGTTFILASDTLKLLQALKLLLGPNLRFIGQYLHKCELTVMKFGTKEDARGPTLRALSSGMAHISTQSMYQKT